MLDWIMLILICVMLVILIVLLVVLARIASVVMGFLGNADGEGPELGNVDMERVIANLVMQGGTQLLHEAKSQEGGLLKMVKDLFKSKDVKKTGEQLDTIALPEGKMAIEAKNPAPDVIKEMLGAGLNGGK